jgi:hypothetical protein
VLDHAALGEKWEENTQGLICWSLSGDAQNDGVETLEDLLGHRNCLLVVCIIRVGIVMRMLTI